MCDFHVQAKNHLKQELKRNETMEYMKNKQDFEQKKQVFFQNYFKSD